MAIPRVLRTARMTGTSIAQPDAAPWATDFLNAAYYAGRDTRDVDDLRLATTILTTRWHRLGRRLAARDLRDFHRAFGKDRLSGRGMLTRQQLLEGADRLFGDDFSAGYADLDRRGWGIVFIASGELGYFDPELRLKDGTLRAMTPPSEPLGEQDWHVYDPVQVPSAARAFHLLGQTRRWPEFASELGRFTAVRRGDLLGQTFEIEVVARLTRRTPAFTRGYVTATKVLEGGDELDAYLGETAAALATADDVKGERRPIPEGARPLGLVELTTHDGHFLGRAISRIVLFGHEGAEWLRDIGSWDPLPLHLAAGYQLGGKRAQKKIWGEGSPSESLLHQVALVSARDA